MDELMQTLMHRKMEMILETMELKQQLIKNLMEEMSQIEVIELMQIKMTAMLLTTENMRNQIQELMCIVRP